MLEFAVAGEVEIHPGVGIAEAVLAEDGLQFAAGHLLGVAAVETQFTQQDCTLAVLGRCDLFEVVKRPIHLIAVDVVDLHTFGARTDPSLPNEMMAETGTKIMHLGISRAAF